MTTVPVSLITSALQSHPFVQVANFLKNDRVESLLLGSLPSLSDSLRAAAGSFLGEESHALLQVRMFKRRKTQSLPCHSKSCDWCFFHSLQCGQHATQPCRHCSLCLKTYVLL